LKSAAHVRWFDFVLVTALAVAFACTAAVVPSGSVETQEINASRAQKPPLDWSPPNVDAPVPTLEATPPCELADVLEQAGERAQELVDNLQSFTAREAIRYEQLDGSGAFMASDTAASAYAVGFERPSGGLHITEARTPAAGSGSLPRGFQDSGLPAIALIFHPYYEDDYDMRCEGFALANGEAAWVIHFEQRKDKPSRTRSFRIEKESYPAALKGRAWISAESNQVLRIETTLWRQFQRFI
jgi:hypothetical protein